MSMLTRRLQVLIDDERHRRLESEAARRGVPVAVLVREALDAAYPTTADDRHAAGDRVLAAEAMPVPDIEELRAELAALRGRHG
ncbi:MAG: antitoxin [Nitriliruptorales bacterium]|nr:antitoxin [Nitriliruptorales bacterium]